MDRDYQNSQAPHQHFTQSEATNFNDVGCAEIQRLVGLKARRLVNRAGLPKCEQEDIEQTLNEFLLKAWPSYDPLQGDRLPFAERVLQNACKVVQRDYFAPKRDRRRCISLSTTVATDEPGVFAELAQLVEQRGVDARTGVDRPSDIEAFELREDVAHLIARLPYELRELARALKYESIQEISQRTGVPRPTLYDRLPQIRKVAERDDLAEYLR